MSLEQQWETFKKDVIPVDAPEVQIDCMKIAFFGGLTQMYYNNKSLADVTDQHAQIKVISWEQELVNFSRLQSLKNAANEPLNG